MLFGSAVTSAAVSGDTRNIIVVFAVGGRGWEGGRVRQDNGVAFDPRQRCGARRKSTDVENNNNYYVITVGEATKTGRSNVSITKQTSVHLTARAIATSARPGVSRVLRDSFSKKIPNPDTNQLMCLRCDARASTRKKLISETKKKNRRRPRL